MTGAKRIGATLWEVNDESTSEFMTSLYHKIKDGVSYVVAYKETKEERKS